MYCMNCKMPICLNRHTAGRGMTLPDFVDLAAAAGFQGADVDLSYGVEHGPAALADLYAKKSLVFGGCGIPFDWRGDEKNIPDGLSALEKQANIAAELKIDTCCIHIMPSSELPLHRNWHFHVQHLAPVAKLLADYGLRFGLEFVSPFHLRRKFPHEFIFTPMAMLELAADIGPNCGLLVDSFHLHAAGEPMNTVARLKPEQIVMVHINDAPSAPLDKLDDRNRLLPGEGVIDLAGFFASLNSIGYAGPVSVEIFSDALRAMPMPQAARNAWTAAQKQIASGIDLPQR